MQLESSEDIFNKAQKDEVSRFDPLENLGSLPAKSALAESAKSVLPELSIDGLNSKHESRSQSLTKESSQPSTEKPTRDNSQSAEKPVSNPKDDRTKIDDSKPEEKPKDDSNAQNIKDADAPQEEIYTDNNGKPARQLDWKSGTHKGERERVLENGAKLHYTPDGKGGEFLEYTNPKGAHQRDHATPDGNGGVNLEHKDFVNPKANYNAHYDKNGNLTIDYADGRHVERKVNSDGTVAITSTGKKAHSNYTALEKKDGETAITYADGSSFTKDKNGKEHVKSKYDNAVMEMFFPSASSYNVATQFELIGLYWMSQNNSVANVRRRDPRLG